jgi:hypothetical protein
MNLLSNRGILVVTPPRSGTHMLVDSLAFSLKRHSIRFTNCDNEFWNHPVVARTDSIVGVHESINNARLFEFSKNKKIITADRHPIGQALSILAMYRRGFSPNWDIKDDCEIKKLSKSLPNSKDFVAFIKSKQFQNFRNITKEWQPYSLCINFDKVLSHDLDEFNRISEYIGVPFIPIDIHRSRKKYNDGIVFLGDPDLWRGVISQDIADDIAKIFPEYDMTTYGNSSLDGNWIFDNALKI